MKIEVDFSGLDKLRQRLDFPKQDFPPERLMNIDKKKLWEGITVSPDDIDIGKDGELLYHNEHVIVYIKDTRQTLDNIRNKKHNAKKFHLAWCRTLDDKNRRGTYKSRYVVTNNTTGLFKVDAFVDDTKTNIIESEEELFVCQNCLDILNYKGFEVGSEKNGRLQFVENFEIGEFFSDYKDSPQIGFMDLPHRTDKTARKAEYSKEFKRRSELAKEKANYTCQDCNVYLGEHKRLLHCHHKDHIKTNDTFANYAVVCALCHKENHHSDNPIMGVPEKDRKLIEKLRDK